MNNSGNSISGYLADLLRRDANSLEILSKLSSAYTDKQQAISIEFVTDSGEKQTFNVPSIAYIVAEIRRVESNINNIISSTVSAATITLPDGSKRVVYSSGAVAEPNIITSVTAPVYFKQLPNKIADYLLNPKICAQISLDSSIRNVSDDILIRKIVVDILDSSSIEYFKTNLSSKSTPYLTLLSELSKRGITYTEYDEQIKVPYRKLKYRGYFDLIDINRNPVTTVVDGNSINTTELVYSLNTIYYKDTSISGGQSVLLKQNDILVVNDGRDYSTKYLVTSVDTAEYKVTLKLIEGNLAPQIGVESFIINPVLTDELILDVPVSVNEYLVVFFKPINKYHDLISDDWGSGIGFYTSELVDSESSQTLQQIQSLVTNINSAISNFSAENFVPLVDGVKPDAPIITDQNFRVERINNHKDDSKQYDALKKKIAEKNKLKSEIDQADVIIQKNKSLIGNGLLSTAEIQSLQKQNQDIISQKSVKVSEYDTMVSDIVANIKESTTDVFKPKYSIRGFWAIPSPKYKDAANKLFPQEAVQFIYRYRYLRTNNTAASTEEIKFPSGEDSTGSSSTLKGNFSNWIEVKTKPRTKFVDTDGKVKWKVDNTEDTETVNSNQLDISITRGENVEIQIKTLSEAGYPYSPLESDFSDSVIVKFPEEFIDDISFDLTTADNESIIAKFLKELNNKGLDEHLSDSITIGERSIKHLANNIGTSFRTPENKMLSVDEMLTQLKTNFEAINAFINKTKGKLQVNITDESGKVLTKVSNNDTARIFGGYYVDAVSNITNPKGEIVSKLFYVEISNIGEADLEILSYVPGVQNDRLPGVNYSTSGFPDDTSYFGYIVNKSEYDNYRKYHRVPISIKSILNDNVLLDHHTDNTNPYNQLPAFQSMQLKGQIAYSRYMDITLSNKLYDKSSNPSDDWLIPTNLSNGSVSGINKAYVWNESGSAAGNGIISDFCVHIDHPDLQAGTDFINNFSTVAYDTTTKMPKANIGGLPTSSVRYPYFCHTKYFNLDATNADGNKQLEYEPYEKVTSGFTVENFPRKIGFTKNDKYLIGQQTCGAYLFMMPDDAKSFYSGSAVYNVGKTIQKSGDSIRIPVLMQYRMTDYDGAGATGTGNIGGYGRPSSTSNLTFVKTIGIDIVIKDEPLFSFDLQVTAQYKPNTVGDLKV